MNMEWKPLLGVSLYLENNVKQCIYLLSSKATEVCGENVFPSLSRIQRNWGKIKPGWSTSLPHVCCTQKQNPSFSVPSDLEDSSKFLIFFISLYYYWWNIEYACTLSQKLIFRNTPSLLLQRFENGILFCDYLSLGILSAWLTHSLIHPSSAETQFCVFLI